MTVWLAGAGSGHHPGLHAWYRRGPRMCIRSRSLGLARGLVRGLVWGLARGLALGLSLGHIPELGISAGVSFGGLRWLSTDDLLVLSALRLGRLAVRRVGGQDGSRDLSPTESWMRLR